MIHISNVIETSSLSPVLQQFLPLTSQIRLSGMHSNAQWHAFCSHESYLATMVGRSQCDFPCTGVWLRNI